MFVTFEGMEGAGKSTIMTMLANRLSGKGDTPVITREPGGSRLGRRLRSMLLDSRQEHISARAELCLFLADRAQHIMEVIQPALEAGQTVFCDRYIDSTIAYQGYGRGMNVDELKTISKIAAGNLEPNLTFLLDLPVQAGLFRAGERNRQEGTVISEGRFDSESRDFHERVRNGYLELARQAPKRIKIIDASRDPDKVCQDCLAAFTKAIDQD